MPKIIDHLLDDYQPLLNACSVTYEKGWVAVFYVVHEEAACAKDLAQQYVDWRDGAKTSPVPDGYQLKFMDTLFDFEEEPYQVVYAFRPNDLQKVIFKVIFHGPEAEQRAREYVQSC